MRRFAAISMLLLAVIAGCGKPVDRTAEENNLRLAVFDYEISRLKAKVYFISTGTEGDPSDAVMKYYEGHVPPVKPASACTSHAKAAPTDKQTGQKGILIKASTVKWISDSTADVDFSYYDGPMHAAIGTCRVAKKGDRWVVEQENPNDKP